MEEKKSIKVHLYDLPDFEIFNEGISETFRIWIPDKVYVILGASNSPEKSLNMENIIYDGAVIYKRPSGGQSVILTPHTIVISALIIAEELNNPKYYFSFFNQKIIETLESFGIKNLVHKGISDIAIGEKKILGSSIYRRKEKLFYHSVLNVSEKIESIDRYLKHPEKEPDYRKGRSHKDFVTSLHEQGYIISNKEICSVLGDVSFCG